MYLPVIFINKILFCLEMYCFSMFYYYCITITNSFLLSQWFDISTFAYAINHKSCQVISGEYIMCDRMPNTSYQRKHLYLYTVGILKNIFTTLGEGMQVVRPSNCHISPAILFTPSISQSANALSRTARLSGIIERTLIAFLKSKTQQSNFHYSTWISK